ncbi:MAG: HAD family hydrolase, partial [Bryobacteraceae bacterium]
SEHCFEFTRLYDGIPELVDTLARRGFTLAVLSNKPDDSTKRMIAHYFKPSPFAAVHGQLPNVAPKPDPAVALHVARDAAIPPAEWLCLGDTDVDMRTARAAGMFAVGALWGFRDREELLASGAQAVVAKPDEVLNLLA